MEKELEELKKKASYDLRIQSQVKAIMNRAKTAEIPDKYMRIGPDQFSEVLFEKYHNDIVKITDVIYKNPDTIISIPFITIDGGTIESRKVAGFAILFRLIACDTFGKYVSCRDLAHKFQAAKSTEDVWRNDLTESMKKDYDILFISEFHKENFNSFYTSSAFFDEILEYRSDNNMPTIISFCDQIGKANGVCDRSCGEFLARLSSQEYANSSDKQENPSKQIFRIRTKG